MWISGRVLEKKAVTAVKELKLSVRHLPLHCLLIGKPSNAIITPTTDQDGHGEAWQAVVGVVVFARQNL